MTKAKVRKNYRLSEEVVKQLADLIENFNQESLGREFTETDVISFLVAHYHKQVIKKEEG